MTNATQNGADLDIDFDLDVPAGTYRIELFENPAGIGGIGLGEGQVFLGAVTVTHAGRRFAVVQRDPDRRDRRRRSTA